MEKELLLGVLTKTLNQTEEEISALLYTKAEDSEELILKEDVLDLVLDADVSRVEKIKKSVKPDKSLLEAQYSRGKEETMRNFETEIQEHYSTETDAKGLDLVKAVVNSETKSKSKFTDDDVKKHPLYLDLEKNRIPKDVHEKLQSEYDDYKNNQAKNARLSVVKKDVLTIFNTLNTIQSENKQVAQTRMDDFLSKFDAYDYEPDPEGGNNHLVLKDGARLEDAHSNPIKFHDFVTQTAQLNYDFTESDNKGNAGNTGGGNGSGDRVDVPKDNADYLAKMAAETDPAKRVKIYETYKAANP